MKCLGVQKSDSVSSIAIHLFSEHQSIPADKTHSGFTKRWQHRPVKNVRYIVAIGLSK